MLEGETEGIEVFDNDLDSINIESNDSTLLLPFNPLPLYQKIYNSTELPVEPAKKKPIRVLMSATKKVVPVNSTEGSEQKENKPIGPPIAEPIKLSEEMLPTENWGQPPITVTLEQTKKPENTINQKNNVQGSPIEAFELVKLVRESIENKIKPLDMPLQQLNLNKEPEKNETVIIAQQKVNPIEPVIKSAVPAKQPVKSELESKKPVPPVESANPDKASTTEPTEKGKTVINMETTKKSEQNESKPAIIRTTTAKTPNKIIPKPFTPNQRGYQKRTKKVKPAVQQQHLERNKKRVELEPQLSTTAVPLKSVNPQGKLIEEKEKPGNKSMGSEQKKGTMQPISDLLN